MPDMKHSIPTLFVVGLIALSRIGGAQAEPRSHCVDCVPEPPARVPARTTPDDGSVARAQKDARARAQEDAEARLREADALEVKRAEAVQVETARLAAQKLKDAEFIRSRDGTILKGTPGSSIQLRGGATVSAGLKELHASDFAAHDVPVGAWKQLHCAAALSNYAFAALKQTTPDYQESGYLLDQATRAMNGQSLGVECPDAPALPQVPGRVVNIERTRESEISLLVRATAIVERMKQRGASLGPPAESAPHAEAAVEKARRVQRELNVANTVKITGTTQAAMDQQERDRKEMTKIILSQKQIETGELVSVTVDITEHPVPTAAGKTERKRN